MHTFETAAVISLVDHLTAPLRSMSSNLSAHEAAAGTAAGRFAQHAARMADAGKHMTFQFTAPVVAGLKSMADKALEFSKIENTMQGVLQQRAKAITGLTTSTKEYAEAQIAATKAAADAAYEGKSGLPRGLVNVKEYMESVLAATKAGYQDMDTTDPTKSMAPAFAVANQASILALANRVGGHEAGDDIMSLANALNVHTRDKDGKALGLDELNKKFGHIADVLSTMYTSSNFADHKEVVQSLKMGAPLARFANLDIGQLAMMSAAQKEAGFKGDESSIAQRSFIGSILAPKNSAYGAFEQMGIHLRDFQKVDGVMSAETFGRQAALKGYKINKAAVEHAFKVFQSEDPNNGANLDTLAGSLTSTVLKSGKSKNPIKPETALKFVNKYMDMLVGSVDVPGVISALRASGKLTPELWSMIGEKRQGPRVLPFLTPPTSKEARDEYAFEGVRQYGPNWRMMEGNHSYGPFAPGPTPQQYVEEQAGIAARQAAEHASKLEGAYTRFNNAYERVVMKLADSGAFERFADLAVKGIDLLSSLTPKQAEMAVNLLAVGAAIGPVLWGLGTLGQVMAGVGAVLGGGGGVGVALARTAAAAPRAAEGLRSVSAAVEAAEKAAERVTARTVARASLAAEEAATAAKEATARAFTARARASAASTEAWMAQNSARLVAENAERLRGVSTTMAEASSRASAEAARAAAEFDKVSGAADRAAETAVEKYAKLQGMLIDRADKAMAEATTRMEARLARADQRFAQSGSLLNKEFPMTAEIERAFGVAQRAAENAAEAARSAESVGSKLLAAQEAAGAAENAASKSAMRLSAALDAAASAAKRAASLPVNEVKPLAEAADAAAKGATRATTEAAARAADVTAKKAALEAAEAGAKHAAQAERSAAMAADLAKPGIQRIVEDGGAFGIKGLLPMLGRVLEAANPILDFYSAVEIGQEKMERTHMMANHTVRQNGGRRTYAEPVSHYDPSWLEHHDAVQAAVILDHAYAERARVRNTRDEGSRGFAAHLDGPSRYAGVPAAPGVPQPPQKVDVATTVTGTVEGKADVAVKGEFTVQPSTYFLGLVKKVENAASMALHGALGGGGSGDYMGGHNGVVQYPGGVHPAGR